MGQVAGIGQLPAAPAASRPPAEEPTETRFSDATEIYHVQGQIPLGGVGGRPGAKPFEVEGQVMGAYTLGRVSGLAGVELSGLYGSQTDPFVGVSFDVGKGAALTTQLFKSGARLYEASYTLGKGATAYAEFTRGPDGSDKVVGVRIPLGR